MKGNSHAYSTYSTVVVIEDVDGTRNKFATTDFTCANHLSMLWNCSQVFWCLRNKFRKQQLTASSSAVL